MKLILSLVLCLVGTALTAPASKQKRDILPGDPRYGTDHHHHHHHDSDNEVQVTKSISSYAGSYSLPTKGYGPPNHVPGNPIGQQETQQPTNAYLSPVTENKQSQVTKVYVPAVQQQVQRPTNQYLSPVGKESVQVTSYGTPVNTPEPERSFEIPPAQTSVTETETVQTQTYQAPVAETHTTILKEQTVQTPVQTQSYLAPVQPQTYQAPVQTQTYQAPVQTQTYLTPVQTQTYQTPVQAQTYQAQTYQAPVQTHAYQAQTYQAPVQTRTYQTPIQTQTYQTPVQVQSYQTPVQTPVVTAPVVRTQSFHQSPAVDQVYQVPLVREQTYQTPVAQQQTYQTAVLREQKPVLPSTSYGVPFQPTAQVIHTHSVVKSPEPAPPAVYDETHGTTQPGSSQGGLFSGNGPFAQFVQQLPQFPQIQGPQLPQGIQTAVSNFQQGYQDFVSNLGSGFSNAFPGNQNSLKTAQQYQVQYDAPVRVQLPATVTQDTRSDAVVVENIHQTPVTTYGVPQKEEPTQLIGENGGYVY